VTAAPYHPCANILTAARPYRIISIPIISAAGLPIIFASNNARASCLGHSFRSVGLGLASAIGLAVANPGKLALLGAGDGGFMMSNFRPRDRAAPEVAAMCVTPSGGLLIVQPSRNLAQAPTPQQLSRRCRAQSPPVFRAP
jgi:hypothetical protein